MSAPTPQSFYQNEDFLNVAYALDLAIINHFSSYLFRGDASRVEYSSNAYAFRKRAKNNDGQLDLPFMNFRATDYEAGERSWWSAKAYTTGAYIDELEQKIQFSPVNITYEASVWFHKDYDLRYAMSEINWDADNKTILQPAVEVEGQTVYFPGLLNYNSPQFEPEYNEQDWLERNQIHSASIPFTLNTFALKSNTTGFWIPTQICFEFAYSKGLDPSVDDYDEAYKLVVDHLTEDTYDEDVVPT